MWFLGGCLRLKSSCIQVKWCIFFYISIISVNLITFCPQFIMLFIATTLFTTWFRISKSYKLCGSKRPIFTPIDGMKDVQPTWNLVTCSCTLISTLPLVIVNAKVSWYELLDRLQYIWESDLCSFLHCVYWQQFCAVIHSRSEKVISIHYCIMCTESSFWEVMHSRSERVISVYYLSVCVCNKQKFWAVTTLQSKLCSCRFSILHYHVWNKYFRVMWQHLWAYNQNILINPLIS
jgi:hypothetical protein